MIPPGFPGEDSTRSAAERDQFRNDLAAVIESPEGFRVLRKIIAGFRRSLQRGRKTAARNDRSKPRRRNPPDCRNSRD